MTSDMLTFEDMHNYQCDASYFLETHMHAALWLDLGMGKTISVLTALYSLRSQGERLCVLLVAPLRVAVNTWPNEIGKWAHTAGLTYTVIRAYGNEPEVLEAKDAAKRMCKAYGMNTAATVRITARAGKRAEEYVRERLLREPTEIHIVSREAVPWLVKKWGRKWPYTRIVYDESSGLRDYTTERVEALRFARKKGVGFWELTGTPAPETYIDLFAQIYLLDRGMRLGVSLTRFREEFFTEDRYARKWDIKPGAADRIINAIKDVVMVLKAEDHLPVNTPVVVDRFVELTPAQQAQYDEFEETLILDLDETEIVAETAPALAQKLLQFASGAVYDAEKKVHPVHDHKLDELREIVEEAQGSPILVAYWFKSSLARLKAAFPQGRTIGKTGEMEKDWSAGKIPIMFVHPASEGHGLNLQYGGHILVFFDIPYPLELYLQIRGRIDRQGQKKVPLIIHLIAKGTVDAGIVPLLKLKKSSQDYLLDRIKNLRERIRHGKG